MGRNGVISSLAVGLGFPPDSKLCTGPCVLSATDVGEDDLPSMVVATRCAVVSQHPKSPDVSTGFSLCRHLSCLLLANNWGNNHYPNTSRNAGELGKCSEREVCR